MLDAPPSLRLTVPLPDEAAFFARFGENLARGALVIAPRTPLAVGTAVRFTVALASGEVMLAGEGAVVGSARPGASDRPGMTLRIARLDEPSRARLDRLRAPAAPKDAAEPPRPRHKRSVNPVLGIDFGTAYLRAALDWAGEVRPLVLDADASALRAAAAWDPSGELLVGSRAQAQIPVEPRSVALAVKRILGRRFHELQNDPLLAGLPCPVVPDEAGECAFRIRGQTVSAVSVAAALLEAIRSRASEDVGRPLERAVIGVPPWFDQRRRERLREAAQLAGLDLVRTVCEPTAVALAAAAGRGFARRRLLACDVGAGGFGAAVVEVTGEELDVVGVRGAEGLGGFDLDRLASEWIVARFVDAHPPGLRDDARVRQLLREAAANARAALSTSPFAEVRVPAAGSRDGEPFALELTLDRASLDALLRPRYERLAGAVSALLAELRLEPGSLDGVVLSGGLARAPTLRQCLVDEAGLRAERIEEAAEDSVARGAALLGRAIADERGSRHPMRLSEVLASRVAACAGGAVELALERNTRLPARKATSALASGRALHVDCFQGDAPPSWLGAAEVRPADGESRLVLDAAEDGAVSLGLLASTGEITPLALDGSGEGPVALVPALAPIPPPRRGGRGNS